MDKLIDYLCDELDELEQKAMKGKLSTTELQYGDLLAHFKKNLISGEQMMGGMEHSFRDGSYNMGGGPYGMGGSYARGGRGGRRGGANQYGSYADGGYSRGGAAEELADAVRGMMHDLPPETQREASKFVQKLEQM